MNAKIKLTCLVVGALFTGSAQAASVDAFAKYTLDGLTVELSDSTSATGYDWADVLRFTTGSAGEIGLHTFGDATAYFGSRSSGAGTFDAFGRVVVKDSYTNTSGSGTYGKFQFNLIPGAINHTIIHPLQGDEFLRSGLAINIKRDGEIVWSSSATLLSNGTDIGQFSSTGADIGLLPTSATHYYLPMYDGTVDLGLIADGETVNIEYEMISFAQGYNEKSNETIIPAWTEHIPEHQEWIEPDYICHSWGSDYGKACYGGEMELVGGGWEVIPEHTIEHPETVVSGWNSASAQSGDPFYFDGEYQYNYWSLLPLTPGMQIAAVPEPETYALMALGLSAVALARRRGRSRSA